MPDDWELREAENDFNEVKMRRPKQKREEANITRIISVPSFYLSIYYHYFCSCFYFRPHYFENHSYHSCSTDKHG